METRNSDEYPYISDVALYHRNYRNPPAVVDDIDQLPIEDGMTVLQYLSIYHADLSSEEIAILSLLIDGGCTQVEVAQALGVSQPAIAQRLQAIREKIRGVDL